MTERMAPPARAPRTFTVVKPKNLFGTLRRLWDLTAGHRGPLGWVLLLSAMISGASVLGPLLIGKAVAAIRGGDPAERLLLWLLILYLSDWGIRALQGFLSATAGQGMVHRIRMSLFTAMKSLPLSFFDRHLHGELMSRLTNDVDNISTTISNSLSSLLTHVFTIVGILTVMTVLSPLLTLLALAGVLLIVLLTRFITGHTRKMFAEQQRTLGRLNARIEEDVSGLATVKLFCREAETKGSFEAENDAYCRASTRAMVWSGFLMPFTNVINNLSFVGISVASGILAVNRLMEIGLITSFLLYIRRFTRPFVELANIYNTFLTAVAGAERILEIMDEPPEPADRPDALSADAPRGDFELRDVSFSYVQGHPVLRHVSLTIPAGTKVAVVGPTGSGKTTLINLLTRFYDVSSGSILLDGHDLRDYRLHGLRESFGVVLQDTSLFAASVRDNIAYGTPGASEEEIRQAAATAGADGFISRLPEGYDTVLAMSGAELSQGERQLLTIARAILTDAPILILDEATSSVDTVTERKIREAVVRMTEGRTSFIIAHRLSTVRDSDLILLLEDGTVAERGTHRELMRQNGLYAAMYRTQTGQADA